MLVQQTSGTGVHGPWCIASFVHRGSLSSMTPGCPCLQRWPVTWHLMCERLLENPNPYIRKKAALCTTPGQLTAVPEAVGSAQSPCQCQCCWYSQPELPAAIQVLAQLRLLHVHGAMPQRHAARSWDTWPDFGDAVVGCQTELSQHLHATCVRCQLAAKSNYMASCTARPMHRVLKKNPELHRGVHGQGC